MSSVSNSVSDKIRSTFNFSVDKFPLSGPDGMSTPLYGLFRSDNSSLVGSKSVTARYHPHTTDDVCALADAAENAFDDDIDVRCHFRAGHYVDVKPNLAQRKAVYGTEDNIWPRVLIRAGYDGESFRASLGYFRDACDNMAMMSMVNGTSVCIRHTSGLRSKMDDLIATFNTLKNSWSNLTDVVDQMQSREVVLTDFLNQLYPQPTAAEGRGVTIHRNRTESIVRRVIRERMSTGRPTLVGNFKISAWEAYNAIQGYVQHDAIARKGFSGEFDRIIRAANDQTVRKAERLALAA
tara:strand:+ start:1075 stop:1956 length:882 start_codon:yes stop_codon:yes gene_type:complete